MGYQMSLFDIINNRQEFKIDKPIRLIELFAGYGSQHFALEYLGANFESWKICEWAVKSIQAYKDAHFSHDNTDYSKGLSKDEIDQFLFKKSISSNYNEPMSFEQIKRLGEDKARTIYNNIIATHNIVSVVNCKAEDLELVDRDKYTYMLTYSFPCQDLSKAGYGKGMTKCSGTRSGMLWEVERILDECNGNLPQALVMENVPDVIGEKNKLDFAKWYQKLESLGYANFYQILNAKDYGIPQNRARCFMVSILGDYFYNFPSKVKLEKRLKDFLEPHVDEKYYLSEKMINYISATNQKWTGNNNGAYINKDIASTLNTGEGSRRCDASNYVSEDLPENIDLSILIKEKTKKGYAVAVDGDGIYINRPQQKRGVVVKTKNKRIHKIIEDNDLFDKDPSFLDIYNQKVVPNDVGSLKAGMDHQQGNIIYNQLRIRKLTPKECFRLMGVKDEDYERIAINQSNASLYHLAGDSIVVDVLMYIFKQMLETKEE